MSGIPDSWTWGQEFAAGTTPGLALPATPGVSHVFTSIAVRLLISSAAVTAGLGYNISVSDDQGILQTVGWVTTGNGTVGTVDEASWQGELAGPPGEGLTIAMAALQANTYVMFVVQGYAT